MGETQITASRATSSCGDQLFLRGDQLFFSAESRAQNRGGQPVRTQGGDDVNLSGAQLPIYISQKSNYYFEMKS